MVAAFITGGVAEAKSRCKTKACELRIQHKQWRQVARPYWQTFERIAACESGGRWDIQNGNGYEGGLQWVHSTWLSVGGAGSAARASKLEQIYRGVLLMRRAGWGQWPVCRRAAGV
jgi:hypothetical protein